MKTIELANKLLALSESLKNKDIYIIAENGLLMEPKIKFNLIIEKDVLNHSSDNIKSIVLTW